MSAPTVHPPDGYSLHDAASVLGVSLNTLRKRIANGQVRAERVQRPQGHVWRIYLDAEHPSNHPSDQNAQLHAAEGFTTVQPPVGSGTMQAEAMAAYTRSILAPMVEALERSEARSRELERAAATLAERLAHVEQDRGRLATELEALKVTQTTLHAELEHERSKLRAETDRTNAQVRQLEHAEGRLEELEEQQDVLQASSTPPHSPTASNLTADPSGSSAKPSPSGEPVSTPWWRRWLSAVYG